MKPFDTQSDTYQALLAARARTQLLRRIETLTLEAKAEAERLRQERLHKYDPGQPRVPSGNSDGGQWTDGGGGNPARPSSAPKLPPMKPIKPLRAPSLPTRRPNGLSPPPMLPKPRPLRVDQLDEGRVNPTWSPFDFIGMPTRPVATAVGRGARAAYNVYRLRGYLDEARQIPKDVREVGKGKDSLSSGQTKSLEEFRRDRSKYKDYIEVTNYSDGRAVFSVKQPARNIPNSFAVWEKQVDAAGKTIRYNKIAVGPNGELIHIRPYGKK